MWGAARGVTVACLVTDLVLYAFPPEHTSRLPRAHRRARLPAPARVRRRHAPARAHADRAAAGGTRRARQGGADRRRRRRGPAPRPRDAAQPAGSPTRRSGFVDDDPRKKNLRIHGVRVLGTTDELAHLDPRQPAGRGADRDAVRAGRAAAQDRRDDARARASPVKTLPGLHELISGDVNLAGQIRPVAVEDVLGREQVEVDLEAVSAYVRDRAVLVTGGGGSIGSELCRQLVAARREAARAGGPGRVGAVRDGARARRRAALPGGDPGARRLRRRGEDARRRSSSTARRSSSTRPPTSTCRCSRRTRCRRSTNNVLATQDDRRGRGRVRRRAVRVHLDRQGREAEEPARPVEGGVRVDRRVVRPPRRRRDALRRGAVRQRARLVRLGDPDLPPPDRARRAGDGDATRR